MKAQILKIAGVKSEKEFYKKYPTQAAFMKVHGKEFKKAQTASAIDKAQGGYSTPGFEQGFGMNPQSQYQNTFTPGNNFVPGNYNVSTPTMNTNSGFQHTNPFAMQNYGQQWGQQNPIPTNNPNSQFSNGVFQNSSNPSPDKKGDDSNPMGKTMDIFGTLVDAGNAYKAEQDQTKLMRTWADVSDVQKRASISNAFTPKQPNQWYKPDDIKNIHSAYEMYNPIGRGTDVLEGQNGAYISQNGNTIGGNPTEIQNIYNGGNDIYTDLNDPNDIKRYASGGGLFSGGTGGNSMVAGMFGNNAGSQFGSIVPGPAGMFTTALGGYLDKEGGKQDHAQSRINENNSFINRMNASDQFHTQYGAYIQNGGELQSYENGGYMNPEYNPQVITMFGDHNDKDFADYAHKYRAGGHLKEYTPPSNRAIQTYENGGEITSYAMGGKLKTYEGGNANDVSYNPHMPGSGESVLLHGRSHNDDGIGISYGDNQNDYQAMAANGANMGPQIEAEDKESMMEMSNGGEINPQTGEQETNAVVIGNIPAKHDVLSLISDNQGFLEYVKKKGNNGRTMKSLFANLTKDEIKATKSKEAAAQIANNADKSKSGALDNATAKTKYDAAEASLKSIANIKIGMAESQDVLNKIKGQISQSLGYNISAEDLGRGKIKKDFDPITKNAPLNDVAKFGASLKKAQGGVNISQDEYDQFQKEYNDSKVSGNKKNPINLKFQRHYHKTFPQEALAAIQKTTKEKGLSNKAKQMGLTKEEIASGKDIDRILQSNEDEFYGPITEQYNANVKNSFTKTPNAPDLQQISLGNTPTTIDSTTKSPIGVVPLKNNNVLDAMGMIGQLFNNNKFPAMDPRQYAGEYSASALNTLQPSPMQKPTVELDPIYRMNYNDVRNSNTAAYRDFLRQNQGNPAANALALGKFAQQEQTLGGEEFRTNQGIEQSIFGGNRGKVNANQATALGLNATNANQASIAKSKTDEINQKIAASMAEKAMKYTADKNKWAVDNALHPNFGFDAAYKAHVQGPGYNPTIPQLYGGKSTIKEIPVKDAKGNVLYYKMVEGDEADVPSGATPPIVASRKNGGSVVKNAKNSSVVRAYKNL